MVDKVAESLVNLDVNQVSDKSKEEEDDGLIYGVLVSPKMGNEMMKSVVFLHEDSIKAKLKGDSKMKPKMKSIQCNHLRDKAAITIWWLDNVDPTLNYIGSMLGLKIMRGTVAITSDAPIEPKNVFDLVLNCNDVLKKTPKMGAALHGCKDFMAVSSVALNQIYTMAGKQVPPAVGVLDSLLAEKEKNEQDLIKQGGSKINGKIVMGRGYDGPAKKSVQQDS